MSITEWLEAYFAEHEHLIDNRGTRHMLSTSRDGKLEIRIGMGDWYAIAGARLNSDLIQSARSAALAPRRYSPESERECPHPPTGMSGSREEVTERILRTQDAHSKSEVP